MRKRFRVFLLAIFFAVAALPFGFAWSPELSSETAPSRSGVVAMISAATMVGTLAGSSDSPPTSPLRPMSDSAALFFVGALLFGLAAAVRKAIVS